MCIRDRGHPVLCYRERGVLLKTLDTFAEAGLQDGSRLILI